jgi:predicted alpha/beta-hydrolase family hydrolase
MTISKIAELKFLSTSSKGEVSALMMRPDDATHLLVLGHGASSNMRAPLVTAIAEHLAMQKIATFRYNFPYSENKRGRDPNPVCVATIRSAVKAAREAVPDLPVLAGGHSFSGRMTTTAASEEPLEGLQGIVLFAFPLHPPGAPDTKRADHLSKVTVPMLFLSGTRDQFSEGLIGPVVENLGDRATLHLVETADHSFKILKRTRTSTEDVFDELARVTAGWAEPLVNLSGP